MKIFLTDNSMDGLLCALYVSFTEKIIPDQIVDKRIYQPSINSITIEILTIKQRAERVKKALFNYAGNDIIAHLKVCLASCDKQATLIAFHYAHCILQERTDVSERLSYKCVSDFSYTVQKVLHERHIMTGFLRFKESENGVLYAQYSPDNDITELLGSHFLRRLGSTPFIIHDVKRNFVCVSDGRSLKSLYTNLPPNFTPSENEEALNNLWKRYYKDINVKERKNLRQQDRFFPRRYRKYAFETWD